MPLNARDKPRDGQLPNTLIAPALPPGRRMRPQM